MTTTLRLAKCPGGFDLLVTDTEAVGYIMGDPRFKIATCRTEVLATVPFGAFDTRPDPITRVWDRIQVKKGLALIYGVKR